MFQISIMFSDITQPDVTKLGMNVEWIVCFKVYAFVPVMLSLLPRVG
jgi:hypothetical protein